MVFPSKKSSNVIGKDYHMSYFSSFLVSSCTLLSRSALGSDLGYVASQGRISFHCRSYAFSLNYLPQTSWLAAMQNSEGSSLRRPKVGSPLSWGWEKKREILSFPLLVSPLKINSLVDSWFWVVHYMLEFFWCKPLVSGLQTL